MDRINRSIKAARASYCATLFLCETFPRLRFFAKNGANGEIYGKERLFFPAILKVRKKSYKHTEKRFDFRRKYCKIDR